MNFEAMNTPTDTPTPSLTDYGNSFTAPCLNVIEIPKARACQGTVHYGPNDDDAACDQCGARCGRLVAFYHSHAWVDLARKQLAAVTQERDALDKEYCHARHQAATAIHELESARKELAAVIQERNAIRICFAEASHNDCRAGHEIKALKGELDASYARELALREALEVLYKVSDAATDELGIYPKEFVGKYTERTPEMDGHNEVVMGLGRANVIVARALNSPPPPVVAKEDAEKLANGYEIMRRLAKDLLVFIGPQQDRDYEPEHDFSLSAQKLMARLDKALAENPLAAYRATQPKP